MEHSLEDNLIKQLDTCYIYTILSDDLILFYDKKIEYCGKASLTKEQVKTIREKRKGKNMSTEEHLYENLMIFVQENGWQAFPEFLTDEEAETIRKKVPCAEFIDNKTFIYLMGLARYVVYNGTVNEEIFCNIDKGV